MVASQDKSSEENGLGRLRCIISTFFWNALRLERKGIKSLLYVSVFPKWLLQQLYLIRLSQGFR